MQEKLIIVLHAGDLDRPDFAIINAEGKAIQVVVGSDPALLAAESNNREIIVIVPAEDTLLTSLILPKMNRARLLQAIPYALEEQINDDVDSLHFAAGEYLANESLPVMVVSRSKMEQWQSLLQSWQIVPDKVISAIFTLPVVASHWYVAVNAVAVVRTGAYSGFACDAENLAELLNLALSDSTPPEEIMVETTGADTISLSLPVSVKQQHLSAEELLRISAERIDTSQALNLLQGDFQNKKSRRMPKLSSVVKISVYLLAAWAFIIFLYPVVSYAILRQRVNALEDQITIIYKRNFPGSSKIVVPKERMQQKLNKLSADISEDHLLLIMANIGKGLAEAQGVQLKRMEFQNNTMILDISAASSEAFSVFTDALAQQGLKVKQQNANLSGTRVTASLQIE
jgi:general secretion pathway protein L